MNYKTIQLEKYNEQQKRLPKEGKQLIAQSNEQGIIVYQAFNPAIANYAIAHQKFGGTSYSFKRMTWIKPNFMWMMYRSAWGTKPHQERILALRLKKEGFRKIVEQAVYSSFKPRLYTTREAWKTALQQSEVRLQWDPDHSPTGEKLSRRAIQLGIKGNILQKMNKDWIIEIIDMSDWVQQQQQHINTSNLMIPVERVVVL